MTTAIQVTERDTTSISNPWTVASVTSAVPTVIGVDPAIDFQLSGPPIAGTLVRVIAKGTGPAPLAGMTGVPLAGAVGGPPGTAGDGVDFVTMLTSN